MIQEQDLKQPPLQLEVLGDIKRLMYQISSLKYNLIFPDAKTKYCLTQSHASSVPSGGGGTAGDHSDQSPAKWSDTLDISSSDESSSGREHSKLVAGATLGPGNGHHGYRSNIASNPLPERWKLGIAVLYGLFVSWLTAVVMTVVHDRVPDMNKYPPLPDIILDNMPHVPWAFEMAEISGMALLSIWLVVVIFHRHRFIIARRCFAIGGTIFLLRCFTMLITSLSVPGVHLDCKPRPYGSWASRLHEAFIIWSGAGLSLQGVRTCGDYMFSGHTVSLTLLNFFITEYTSRRIFFLHTFTWICNIFGVFFILAAHEHYSIDVFVAFYITSRLFLYYHTLVNNRLPTYYNLSTYKESASKKSEISNISPYNYDDENEQKQILQFWFPLFTFFESGIEGGKIPNVFEYPFTIADFKAVKDWIVSSFERKVDGNLRDKPYGNDITDLISEP